MNFPDEIRGKHGALSSQSLRFFLVAARGPQRTSGSAVEQFSSRCLCSAWPDLHTSYAVSTLCYRAQSTWRSGLLTKVHTCINTSVLVVNSGTPWVSRGRLLPPNQSLPADIIHLAKPCFTSTY